MNTRNGTRAPLPPAFGWAFTAAGLAGVGASLVMLGPRVPSTILPSLAGAAIGAGIVALGGGLTSRLREAAKHARGGVNQEAAHAGVWGGAFIAAGLAATYGLRDATVFPDYASVTVGVGSAWPPQWIAFAVGTVTMGLLSGVGSAWVMRRAGAPISIAETLFVGIAWTLAWVLTSAALVMVVALGSGVTAQIGGANRLLEIPAILLVCAAGGGLTGLATGWIGEAALALVTRRDQATRSGQAETRT
jgi:hypothetical protein